ncbi:MAG: hypothetical protein KF887_15995 [Paracoccaceae bacterium]|nr:MAG: hypothetical protein KF887_15995 [Paracoccaceae bacterium]
MRAALALPLVLAACAAFPEVERAEGAYSDAPAPQLLPTDQVLAMESGAIATDDRRAALIARADALRARAATIRRRPAP